MTNLKKPMKPTPPPTRVISEGGRHGNTFNLIGLGIVIIGAVFVGVDLILMVLS